MPYRTCIGGGGEMSNDVVVFIDQCGPRPDHVRWTDGCCGKQPFEAMWLGDIVGIHSDQQVAARLFDKVVEREGQLGKSRTEQPDPGIGSKRAQIVEEFVAAGICANQKLEVGMTLSQNAFDCDAQMWIRAIDAEDHTYCYSAGQRAIGRWGGHGCRT